MPVLDQSVDIAVGTVRVLCSSRDDGDFAVGAPQPGFDAVRSVLQPAPWTWLRQVHGADVVVVEAAGEHAGATADGVATAAMGAPIAVTTADCAPVVLVGSCAVAVVHAGWRGLLAGVIEAAAQRLRSMDASPVTTILGPSILPERYEFSPADLAPLVERFGPDVATFTAEGLPALDVAAAVRAACEKAGWSAPDLVPAACTSGEGFYSHRTRGDAERLTTVAWIEPAGDVLAVGTQA